MIEARLASLKISHLLNVAADASKGTLLLVMTLKLDLALDNTSCKSAKATQLIRWGTVQDFDQRLQGILDNGILKELARTAGDSQSLVTSTM